MCDSPFVLTPQAVWIACNILSVCFPEISALMFQYRKRYGLHAIRADRFASIEIAHVSIPQAVLIACNVLGMTLGRCMPPVSIPQAVWIACNNFEYTTDSGVKLFQYRKRYGLHAMTKALTKDELKAFQYRKRYGLHAIRRSEPLSSKVSSFNTASGMDCMQFVEGTGEILADKSVSIPQAVWIACNAENGIIEVWQTSFQYRKRYGLHAICSW